MHISVLTSSGKRHKSTFAVQMRLQWGKLVNVGHDTIARWKDGLVGAIHTTYGLTKIEAELQIREFERIRRGYQPSLAE